VCGGEERSVEGSVGVGAGETEVGGWSFWLRVKGRALRVVQELLL
jgi:hypothetical protein